MFVCLSLLQSRLVVVALSFRIGAVLCGSGGHQHVGEHGEFYRYSRIYDKPPDDNDRREMIEMAADVKCEVCETILLGLISRAHSNSEDDIMDQLDGVGEPPVPTEDKQVNRINFARKGCNKHFKDELLHKGFTVKRCATRSANEEIPDVEPAEKLKDFCLMNSTTFPSERTVNTYNQRSEVAFYACEHTIGRHGLELGPFLARVLKEGHPPDAAIRQACFEVADCNGARMERRQAAQHKRREAGSVAESRAKPKQTKDGDHEEESYLDIIARERKASKRRKRSRNRSGTHTEL